MDLEILERGVPVSGKPSLLFVHGFWQAAWSWDEKILPGLAERGHHCIALSLRGHGESDGRVRGASVADYVDDVSAVASLLEVDPVIVGHSMGGFTSMHYLAGGHRARAVVLVSPVPRKGAWGATIKVAAAHPWRFLKANLTLDIGAVVETEQAAYNLLVSRSLPPSHITPYMERLERASYRVYLDMLFRRPDLSDVDVPALVIGGAEDAFFTDEEWRDTARALGADLVVLDGVGHQPMWEDDGRLLVEHIDRFAASLT